MNITRVVSRRGFSTKIQHVGVVGMGLMGHGIVQLSAFNGFKVTAVDIDAAQLQKGLDSVSSSLEKVLKKQVEKGKLSAAESAQKMAEVQGRIISSSRVEDVAACDIVVEAIIENLDIKKKFFNQLGELTKPGTILASNTSSFPITQLGEASGRPQDFVGVHFFNPVQMMQLVEVIKTGATSETAFTETWEYTKAIGKTPVSCRDTPGFIVNRLLVPFLAQALLMLERGDASVQDIDNAMKYGAGMPMGPLILADYVGLDTTLSILQGWTSRHPDEPAFCVPKALQAKVEAGDLGRKTGKGFYVWKGDKPIGLA
eukprot:NODE_2786_length_1120_cov_144.191410_g2557_i0.p1 GENE.NODE_2786_length_1120_cov_144.191410_g2557_i0~~NODE_2786_length_1120_cov_144.191410_g2557_i0.p1  ORF type:complete len:334 (-),score=69.73 NODE_2786_length_1120_cov_144.191410_g2557_i0:117-1058(-)